MIEINNLNKTYFGKGNRKKTEKALHNINLAIESGEFFCILGPSGCGKTTLLNILAGFVKDYEGEIFINSRHIHETDEKRIMIFQENALFPWLTVSQNLELGMKMAKIKNREEREHSINKYLELVGLENKKDSYIHELSGGMKQRVELGRALALDTEILLMDEPFGALDQITKSVMREELIKIWSNERKTVIFVTHDIEEAVLLADRIAVMGTNPGCIKKVIKLDESREIRKNEQFLSTIKEEVKGIMLQ